MNLFDRTVELLAEERFDTLLDRPGLRIERIVSTGHVTAAGDWFDQPRDEWVVLLEGWALLEIEGRGELRLAPGDHVHIPAHVRHRVTETPPDGRTLWLAVHFDPPPV